MVEKHVRRPGVAAWNDDDHLFLNFHGKPLDATALGNLYTRFMERHFQCHFTTTDYRCLVQTTACDALDAGTITVAERNSFNAVNGHSGNTCSKFYRKRSMVESANHAVAGFNKMLGTGVTPEPFSYKHITSIKPFGTLHSASAGVKRARWDEKELEQVRNVPTWFYCNYSDCSWRRSVPS